MKKRYFIVKLKNEKEYKISATSMENACILAAAKEIESGNENPEITEIKPYKRNPVEEPYIYGTEQDLFTRREKPLVSIQKRYNKNYGDKRMCKCGHSYYRHFDSWENMDACGCKYCGCFTFVEKKEETKEE